MEEFVAVKGCYVLKVESGESCLDNENCVGIRVLRSYQSDSLTDIPEKPCYASSKESDSIVFE